jgi:1,4-dihydroxy-2-naphthoyl-CoA synthase
MDFSNYQRLLFKRSGKLLTITLNRPEELNATDDCMHAELARVFTDCTDDAETDVIILTGAGRCFSAGGGYESMQRTIDNPDRFEKLSAEAKRIVYSMLDCPKPLIAKVTAILRRVLRCRARQDRRPACQSRFCRGRRRGRDLAAIAGICQGQRIFADR